MSTPNRLPQPGIVMHDGQSIHNVYGLTGRMDWTSRRIAQEYLVARQLDESNQGRPTEQVPVTKEVTRLGIRGWLFGGNFPISLAVAGLSLALANGIANRDKIEDLFVADQDAVPTHVAPGAPNLSSIRVEFDKQQLQIPG